MADLLRRRGEFIHRRQLPELPPGYDDWSAQKKVYCRFSSGTIKRAHAGYPRIQHKIRPGRFGLVFCHRGYYERAAHIVENSLSAIAWGFAHNFFLHEVDCRFGSDSSGPDTRNYQFIAHDLGPERVTSWRLQDWSELAYEQVQETQLVSRRVDLDNLDFASTYLRAHEKVPRLRQAMHMDHTIPYGLQIDLREDDFAKAIVEFTSHYPKVKNPRARMFISDTEYQRQNVILKGYNIRYASYGMLIHRARQYARAEYGRQFHPDQLFECPNLTMVFYPGPLVDLAMQRRGMSPRASIKERWNSLTLEHLTSVAREQIQSFVNIEIGEGVYNFMLEIVYSGLGLGYHGYPESKKPSNGPAKPLTGESLDFSDLEILFESRVDRAMIDVALELRRDNPDVVLSSCTRLADVITPDGMKYGTRYDNGSLTPWPEGQKGLTRELRAMHGGLYPQSDLVVADDPDAEVAARTWIDQYSSLNRSELLNKPYYEWLSNEPKVYDAIWEISHGEFLANKCEEYEVGESQGEQRERIETAMDRMYEGKAPVGDVEQMPSSPEIEAQETGAVREDDVTRQQPLEQKAPNQVPARGQAAASIAERNFQRMVEQFEAKERRERKQRMEWKRNASTARSKGDRTRLPPPSEVKRLHNQTLREKAERQSERELEQAKERRKRRFQGAADNANERVIGEAEPQHVLYAESRGYGLGHNDQFNDQGNLNNMEITSISTRDRNNIESRDNGQSHSMNYQGGNYQVANQGYANNIEMNARTQRAGNYTDGRGRNDDQGWCLCCSCCCSGSERD